MTISYTSTPGLSELGGYAVSITDANGVPYPDGTGSYAAQTRTFPVDTSFEPYRREAFRHKSIPGQREAIQMTNIMGEGTVNTEGLWRREQREWNQGAGQQYLDHKDDDQPGRFYSSKGIDVFNYPYQATLLPDVYQSVPIATVYGNAQALSCNGYMVVGYSYTGTVTVKYYTNFSSPYTQWSGATAISSWTGGTTPNTLYDMTAANSYLYIATDTGIWYTSPGPGAVWTCFASGSYTMVSWANDQLIAANGPTLYAFQPRSATTAPLFGSAPSNTVTTQNISGIGNSGSALVQLAGTNPGFVVGQSVSIANTQTLALISSIALTSGVVTATCNSGYPHGLQVGNSIALSLGYSSSSVTENAVVTAINTSTNTFSWRTKNVTTVTGFTSGTATATTSPYNGTWNVSAISGNVLTIQLAGATNPSNVTYGSQTIGGSIGNQNVPDVLFTHSDPNWVWSDAVGGETQVYFSGYSKRNGASGNGCIYRSDLLGASTTISTNVQSVSTATVAQPFQLVSPVQALPMSPDEYPTCIQSYLNYIFIGTNRGIRMAQTLSIYDPTATSTGDLKSGPLIPNILQPLSSPVTAIIGDGRFVWFAWNNYDSTSTGLGKLDLTTFIAGDPLAPVYASDIMVTGQGTINSLAWNPVLNLPVLTVGGLGVYQPIAQNTNGRMVALKCVPTGTLNTSIFDYGIPDQKAPVYFEYGGVTPSSAYISANVICEPLESFAETLSVASFTSPTTIGTATKEYTLSSNPKSSQFQVQMVLTAGNNTYTPTSYSATTSALTIMVSNSFGIGEQIAIAGLPSGYNGTYYVASASSGQFTVTGTFTAVSSTPAPSGSTVTTFNTATPIMYRWTLKAFPNVVSGTNIMVVLQLFSVDVVDGVEVYMDPYDNFYWLESLRQAQNLVTYQEGPLSTNIAIIESLDWIPHKRRDNYENGFEGDCVVTLKTLGPYSYTTPATA